MPYGSRDPRDLSAVVTADVANPCWVAISEGLAGVFGYRAADLIGESSLEFVVDDEHQRPLREAFADSGLLEGLVLLRGAGGGIVPVSYLATALAGAEGELWVSTSRIVVPELRLTADALASVRERARRARQVAEDARLRAAVMRTAGRSHLLEAPQQRGSSVRIEKGHSEQEESADVRRDRAKLMVERRTAEWQPSGLVSTMTNPKWLGPQDTHPLVRARKQAGLTQRQAATQSGVSYATLQRMEQGGGTVLDNFVRLANLYGISLDELIGRDPE